MLSRRGGPASCVILQNKGNNLKHGFRLDLVDYNDPPRPSDTSPLCIREGPRGGSIKRYLNTDELHSWRAFLFICINLFYNIFPDFLIEYEVFIHNQSQIGHQASPSTN